MKSTLKNAVVLSVVGLAMIGGVGVHAQTTTTYGTLGSSTIPTQTITTRSGNSMSQSSQVVSPPVRVLGAPVSAYGSSTTTVTGGYTVGGSGQPLTNNTTGSRSSTTYGAGFQVNFK